MFKSNDELLEMSKVLVNNHEKLKQEIIILHELLVQVETDYVEVINELKKRNQ